MTEEEIIEFLTENLDYFTTNNIVSTILRSIGWLLVQGFNALIDACSALYDHTFALIDITLWTGLEEFIGEYDPVIKAFLILSLVVLGYMFIFGKEKKNDLIMSALIFAVIFTSSSYLFTTFNSWAVLFKNAVVGSENTTSGYTLVNQNLYDLLYINDQLEGLENMEGDVRPPQYEALDKNDIQMINITETLPDDTDGLSAQSKDILGKRLQYGNVENKLIDVYNGALWTDFANTYYYRYTFDFATYYLTAIAAIIVFIGVSYKNVRIVYELFISRILVTLFSADMSSKKKAVRILESIRDGYYALCFTAITLRSYFLFTDFLVDRNSIGGLARGIILVFLAFCVVDGANIMQQITGVDAGLSSMTGKLIAGFHMVRGATQTVQQARQFGMLKRQSRAMQQMSRNQSDAFQSQGAENLEGRSENAESGEGGMNGSGADPDNRNMETSNSGTGTNGESSRSNIENGSEDPPNSNYEKMDQTMDQTMKNPESSNMDQQEKGAGAADSTEKKFSDMDDAIGKNRPEKSYSDEPLHTPGSGSSNGEKGMFEKWDEKSAGSQYRETRQDTLGRTKPARDLSSENRSENNRTNFDKKEN